LAVAAKPGGLPDLLLFAGCAEDKKEEEEERRRLEAKAKAKKKSKTR